jgi:hypothetical protein
MRAVTVEDLPVRSREQRARFVTSQRFIEKSDFFLRQLDAKQNITTEQVTCFETLFCLGKSLAKCKIRRQKEINHWNPI